MFRKVVIFSLVLALLLAALPGSAGLASPTSEIESIGNRYGKVTAVTPTSITIVQFNEANKVILVDSTTKIYGVTGAKRTLSDIKVGSWVYANGPVVDTGDLAASVVILVTTKYTTEAYWNYPRDYGTVISVDAPHGVFFFRSERSGIVKVIAYGSTRFLNKKVKSVAKIRVGMKVVVSGTKQSNGFILASAVIAFKPAKR